MKTKVLAPQRGFTIVEMLVALVVLSIGMLGVASLFAVSLRSGGSAIQRTQAVALASNMADRIRANRRAGNSYTAATVTSSDNKCSSNTCTTDEMAKADVYQWRQEIAAAFPGGSATGTVTYTAPATVRDPAQYTIAVKWKEQGRNSTEASLAQDYTLQIQVPMY